MDRGVPASSFPALLTIAALSAAVAVFASPAFAQSTSLPATSTASAPTTTVSTSSAPANDPVAASATTQPASAAKLAGLAPAWTGVYLEVRDLAGLVAMVCEASENVEGASGQVRKAGAALLSGAERLSGMFEGIFGLKGRDLLTGIMGQRAAVAWGGPDLPDQFGLICEAPSEGAIQELLERGKAELIEAKDGDAIRRYKLSSEGLRAAVAGDRLIVGTVGETGDTGMYYGMVALAEGANDRSLWSRLAFREANRHVDSDSQLIFVALGTEPKEEASDEGGRFRLLRGLERIEYLTVGGQAAGDDLRLRLTVHPKQVDFSLWPQQPLEFEPPVLRLFRQERLAMVYATAIEPSQWYQSMFSMTSDQGRSTVREYLAMLEILLPDPHARQRFLESVGSELVFLVRSQTPSVTTQPAATSPADASEASVAMLVRLAAPVVAEQTVRQITALLRSFTSPRASDDAAVNSLSYRGVVIRRIPVSFLSGRRIWPEFLPIAHSREISWCILDDYLVLTTDRTWLAEMIDLYSGTSEGQTADIMPATTVADWFLGMDLPRLTAIMGGPAGQAEAVEPAATQPKGGDPQIVLGILKTTVKDPQSGRDEISVAAVAPGYPAWGVLMPGDVIVAVDETSLNAGDPDEHLRALIAERAGQDRLTVTVRRQNVLRQVVIDVGPQATVTGKTLNLLRGAIELAGRRFDRFKVSANYTPTGQTVLRVDLESDD